MFPKSKTELAKSIVHMIVAAKAQSVVEDQMVQRTDYTEDDLVVQVTSFAAGHLIAMKTDPYTDRLVDYAISKFQAWRENAETQEDETQES